MAYCTSADVQQLIKFTVFSASSKITLDDIDNFYIPDVDAEINGRIQALYLTPVTNATDIAILKRVSVRMAAVQVVQVLITQNGGKAPEILAIWASDAAKILNAILTKEIILANTSVQGVSSDAAQNLYSHTAQSADAPAIVWHSGTDEW